MRESGAAAEKRGSPPKNRANQRGEREISFLLADGLC